MKVLQGEALDRLREFEAESFHAIVTDPPYGLSRQPDMAEVLKHWLAGDDYTHRGGGFMGQSWDSFVPGPATWREAMRVLKPGGYLLAFGGSRTYDLLVTAIRLAGFEVRDTITWLYGQGFPKSRDISKALDERAGAEREVVGTKLGQPGYSLNQTRDDSVTYGVFGDPAGECAITAPATPDAVRWEGWGTALKPGYEPIVVARRPFKGPVELNVVEHGTGALHVNANRIPLEGESPAAKRRRSTTPGSVADRRAGEGRAIINRSSDDAYQRERPGEAAGRFPPNVLLTHAPECNGQCVPGCPVAQLDDQAGELRSGAIPEHGLRRNTDKFRTAYGDFKGEPVEASSAGYADTGAASRFFPTSRWDDDELVREARMLYVAKAGTSERAAGLAGGPETEGYVTGLRGFSTVRRCPDHDTSIPSGSNAYACGCAVLYEGTDARTTLNPHPTVKPIDLMRWLVRLVVPPGGRALDLYAGSGTTLCALALEGFDGVGVERDPEFADLAERRIAFWAAQPVGIETGKAIDGDKTRQRVAETGQASLL